MKDVMIDLETFGNGKNACVVQIGACYFDRVTGEVGETLKYNVDARSAAESGAQLDADTVYWWLSQSKEAVASVTADPKQSIDFVFRQLNGFLDKAQCIWSHATFDFVIVMETFKRLGIKPSFSFRAARDIRTLVDLAKLDTKLFRRTVGTHHDALDDAIFQVNYCVAALNLLKGAS